MFLNLFVLFFLVSPFFFFFFLFCFFFSVLITSLREEGAGLCASRTFVCLFCACMFCPFSLPLGVEGWLRFVIVAYSGPFY